MPLFGHKHHDKNKADAGHEGQTDYNNNSGVTGSGGGGNRLHKDQHNDPLHPSSNAPGDGYGRQQRETGVGGGAAQHGGFNNNPASNDPYANDGRGQPGQGVGGAAGATGGAARQGMAPQTDVSGNPAQSHGGGGGGSRVAGKVESAMGSMLGSESIKRKGQEKDQESEALKIQAAELGEAERLEQAAYAARQRAVAHGAHPEHQHLGSHNPGAGTQNANKHVGGANIDQGGAGSGARGGY